MSQATSTRCTPIKGGAGVSATAAAPILIAAAAATGTRNETALPLGADSNNHDNLKLFLTKSMASKFWISDAPT